jgi:hypothetical protein
MIRIGKRPFNWTWMWNPRGQNMNKQRQKQTDNKGCMGIGETWAGSLKQLIANTSLL